MKKTSDYFLHVKHIVFVEHKDHTYMREENIIDGRISLLWTLKKKNEYGTWDDVSYVSDKKLLEELNTEYAQMSYSEMFKK